MKRKDIVDEKIKPGNVIVGLSSFGKAKYEDEYNGGIGSNGLTSARHDVFSKIYAKKYPESYDPLISKEMVYSGSRHIREKIKVGKMKLELGKLMLSPTRTYAPIIKKVLEKHRKSINGIIHCSGGGQTKVLKFVKGVHIIKDNLFDTPFLFKLIQKESKTDWKEMYHVFNMGHRMEIYTDEETANKIISISKSYGVDAQVIGRVEKSQDKKNKLTIRSEYGEFIYE
jgi:phosphoribosylformylglycinamidine cyclo-ligase